MKHPVMTRKKKKHPGSDLYNFNLEINKGVIHTKIFLYEDGDFLIYKT